VEINILIVDDEESIRDLLIRIFSGEGYKVKSVETAEKALEVLKDENYQIFFIDIQLPGMNGLELCRTIRKDNHTAILFAMTGYSSVFQLVEARQVGFDDYFEKPFSLKLILKATEEASERLLRWRRGK